MNERQRAMYGAVTQVAEDIVKAKGDITPQVACIVGRGIIIVSMYAGDPARALPAILSKFKPDYYILSSTAWMYESTEEKTDPDILSGRKRVADLPLDDRTEILTHVFAVNGGTYQIEIKKIRRVREDVDIELLKTITEKVVGNNLQGGMVVRKW